MKEINLEEILYKKEAEHGWNIMPAFRLVIKEAMKEACDQTVDLCVENAKATHLDNNLTVVEAKSILKTKDQIV